jgi:prophage regulatory protein
MNTQAPLRRVLRPKQFAEKYGIGLSSFWRHVKSDPTFPRPFKLTERTTAIDEAEADAWYQQKRAAKQAPV